MKKIETVDSIRQPIITEKATILSEQNKTVFKVHSGATKKNIKKNIEKLFKVKVIKVNSCRLSRKKKRVGKYIGWKPQYKKAIVSLAKGDVIDLYTEN